MKTKLSLLAILLLALLASAATADDVFVILKVDTKVENHDRPPHEDRLMWLDIRVTNNSPGMLDGATLQWKIFRETLEFGPNRVALERAGEERLSVPGKGEFVEITTPKVPFKYTLPHSIRTGRRYFRRIPESGTRYHGYMVQVVKDGRVIAEALSNESLRQWENAKGKP